mmetsp:Transcript_27681/g.77404  ORF Transcript_27681/g.77404 Transcript_27681/m.77404 type:complete len:538 (+) Transcript_27681:1-1614(+)
MAQQAGATVPYPSPDGGTEAGSAAKKASEAIEGTLDQMHMNQRRKRVASVVASRKSVYETTSSSAPYIKGNTTGQRRVYADDGVFSLDLKPWDNDEGDDEGDIYQVDRDRKRDQVLETMHPVIRQYLVDELQNESVWKKYNIQSWALEVIDAEGDSRDSSPQPAESRAPAENARASRRSKSDQTLLEAILESGSCEDGEEAPGQKGKGPEGEDEAPLPRSSTMGLLDRNISSRIKRKQNGLPRLRDIRSDMFLFREMTKRGQVHKNWLTRFCALTRQSVLYYFVDRQDDRMALNMIVLAEPGVVVKIDDEISSRNFCIQIQTRNRKYYFAAENQHWMEIWLKGLRLCLGSQSQAREGQDAMLAFREEIAEDLTSRVGGGVSTGGKKMQGFLLKRGQLVKNWKTRWFDLTDNRITYFKNRQDPKPAGQIVLDKSCSVRLVSPSECREIKAPNDFGFLLVANNRPLFMCGSSEDDVKQWMLAIEPLLETPTITPSITGDGADSAPPREEEYLDEDEYELAEGLEENFGMDDIVVDEIVE